VDLSSKSIGLKMKSYSESWREWRDSNSLLAGLESAALPVALHSHGPPGWIRTSTEPVLSRPPLPLDYGRMNLVRAGGIEPPRPKRLIYSQLSPPPAQRAHGREPGSRTPSRRLR